MKKVCVILLMMTSGILFSCSIDKNETNLQLGEKKFIQGLGILDFKEDIEVFECNGGFEDVTQSGNFITAKRVASYWIENGEKEVNSALFATEIDSISETDFTKSVTNASYLTIYKTDGSSFMVYVDADSTRTHQFFNQAMDNWKKYRKNK